MNSTVVNQLDIFFVEKKSEFYLSWNSVGRRERGGDSARYGAGRSSAPLGPDTRHFWKLPVGKLMAPPRTPAPNKKKGRPSERKRKKKFKKKKSIESSALTNEAFGWSIECVILNEIDVLD